MEKPVDSDIHICGKVFFGLGECKRYHSRDRKTFLALAREEQA
jgi:hypothetical protein